MEKVIVKKKVLEQYDSYVNEVNKMLELQEQYFENGKHKSDYVAYKIQKEKVKASTFVYLELQASFYCEKYLNGAEKCKFECNECDILYQWNKKIENI